MIEIMLWKFLWTYQKNHAIENHTMENHVRRGLTVFYISSHARLLFFIFFVPFLIIFSNFPSNTLWSAPIMGQKVDKRLVRFVFEPIFRLDFRY